MEAANSEATETEVEIVTGTDNAHHSSTGTKYNVRPAKLEATVSATMSAESQHRSITYRIQVKGTRQCEKERVSICHGKQQSEDQPRQNELPRHFP